MSSPEQEKPGDPRKRAAAEPGTQQKKTVPIAAVIIAELPKPKERAAGPKLDSFSRLDHLYAIGKVFAEFESAKEPLEEVLAVISNTLPIRTAILINEATGHARQ